jgi:glycosyltransferase involved in cell wall biosynthesis
MGAVTLGFYDESRSRGGTTRYLLDLLACLDRNRYEPVFFALNSYDWHQDLLDLGIPVYTARGMRSPRDETVGHPQPSAMGKASARLPRPLNWSLGMAKYIGSPARLWKDHPVNVLHVNICGTEPAPVAARLAGCRRVVGVYHISPSYDLEGRRQGQPYRGLETWALRSLHSAIACSRFTQRDWESRFPIPKGRMTTVQNGIDLSRGERSQSRDDAKAALGFGGDVLLIGCVANLHPYKGHRHLIEAFRRVRAAHPEARLVLAGAGALEAELREQAQVLRDGVVFLGYCEEVRSVLEALDLYVQPSITEALGLAVLEASAMGLPVVASDVGGLPEVVRTGETGLLVPPADPEPLAKTMSDLLADPERRREFGAAGAEMVRKDFTRERMAEETCAVYERLLADAPSAAPATARAAL